MRSYDQYCAVAKALDVIGDRWNLLIVRELMLRDGCRYTDLHDGLPGIATNLLADRLRDLERAGVVMREQAPAPVATTLFHLTDRGRALKPVLVELLRWGAPLMAEPTGDEAFRSYWLAVPADLFLTDRTPEEPPIAIELRPDSADAVTIETVGGGVRTQPGPAEDPALILSGPPPALMGVLSGQLELAGAEHHGLRYDGDLAALERVAAGPQALA